MKKLMAVHQKPVGLEGVAARKTQIRILCAALSMSLTACFSAPYQPKLSLPQSPASIDAQVAMELFTDSSPAGDRKKGIGFTVTEPGGKAGGPSVKITKAVLSDFRNNQVFKNIHKGIDNPDLIMKGEVHRFYGKARPKSFVYATWPVGFIYLFGIPIADEEGVVEIEVSLHKPDGSVVGKYSGKSEFSDQATWYEAMRYLTGNMNISTQVNKAFSDSIAQIREKILNDKDRLSRISSFEGASHG